jgi:heme exporter protein B
LVTTEIEFNVKRLALLPSVLQLLSLELKAASRERFACAVPALFYLIVVSLFALVFAAEPQLLMRLAVPVIWIAVVLAGLLALERGLRAELISGCLEQCCLSALPLPGIMLVKLLSHWLLVMLPMIALTPLVASALHLPVDQISVLLLSLLLGTPIISLVSGIGGALTVGLPNGGIFLALILLPLYVPVVVFGIGLVTTASQGLPVVGLVALLLGLLLLALSLAPLAMAAALRVALMG